MKPLEESDDEKVDEKNENEEPDQAGQQNNYLDDSDDLDETVEVRMGQDSASREYS